MATLEVPKSGISLVRTLDKNLHPNGPPKTHQVMRLNLDNQDTKNLLQSLYQNEKVRIRFGKRQTLLYGDKSIQLFAHPEIGRAELYLSKPDKNDNLFFNGELSHRLEIQDARDVLASTDKALAKFQETMRSMNEKKASDQTQIVNDRLALGHKKTLSKGLSPLPTQRLLNSRPTSSPSSPSLMALGSTPRLTPTSTPFPGSITLSEEDQIRLAAIKTPLIHMLAVEPHTLKELCSKLRCPRDLCKRLLTKHAEEIKTDPGRYELKDKTYKELDVWKFAYPSQKVRQQVIDRAVTAFDRMRVTRKDEAWQMLLPKEERGKGVVLSRSNLQGVPRALPPKPAEADTESKTTPVPDRPKPAPEPKKAHARTPSQISGTNKHVTATTEVDEPKPKAKPKTAAPKATQQSRKHGRADETKYKSSEFVQDSDDEGEIVEVQPAKKVKVEASPSKPAPKQAGKQPAATSISQTSKQPKQVSSRKEGAIPKLPTPSRPRTDSSPRKPSPLGSSPPTNANDSDTLSKVSSKASITSNTTASSANSVTVASSRLPEKASKPAVTSAASKPEKSLSNGVKRKADVQEDHTEAKRLQAAHASAEAERGRPQNRGPAPRDRPVVQDNNRNLTSSAARSSGNSGSSSGSASPPDHEELEQKARAFKTKWERYREFHERVVRMGSKARPEDMDKLKRMQSRIRDLKQEIWRDYNRGSVN